MVRGSMLCMYPSVPDGMTLADVVHTHGSEDMMVSIYPSTSWYELTLFLLLYIDIGRLAH